MSELRERHFPAIPTLRTYPEFIFFRFSSIIDQYLLVMKLHFPNIIFDNSNSKD